jgi:hypothetical protein
MYGNAKYHVRCRENLVNESGQTFHFEKLWNFLYKAKKYKTTCILHKSFSSILRNHLMIVRLDLQCESPYIQGLWYFYLTSRMNKKSRLWCRVFGHVSIYVYAVAGGSYSRFGRLVYVLVCILGRFDQYTAARCHWCIFGEYICVDLETGIFISILSCLSILINVFLILFLFFNEFLLIQSLEL